MAIVFTTGTISQPDAGSVGLAMAEKIRDDLVAHAAWELVEEFTAGGGLVRWYVFRCLSGVSGLPSHFYVVMGRTLSSGEIRMTICEDYNDVTNTMSFYPNQSASTTTKVFDVSGRNSTDTYVLSTAVFPGSSGTPWFQAWIPNATSTKWWLCVADDGFTVAFNGANNGFMHVGAFTPITELAWPMPLQIMGYSASGGVSVSGRCSLTRNPAMASAAAGWLGSLVTDGGDGSVAGGIGPVLGPRGDIRYNDKLQDNQRAVAEQGMSIGSVAGQTDYATTTGWFVGKHKRMRLGGGSAPAGFAFGDAYELNGTLWVPYLPADLRIWDTGVAAA